MTPDTQTLLSQLAGSWRGSGEGNYPTIERFEYDEILQFEFDPAYPLIHYEQRTRLRDGEASHWESGFLRWLEDGSIEISNAQDGGRVEVLRGALMPGEADGHFTLELRSDTFGNDPRLVETRRTIVFSGDRLVYRMEMSTHTTDTPRLLQHLEATLMRSSLPLNAWVSD